MTPSLLKIEAALEKHAPTVVSVERHLYQDPEDFCVAGVLFVGKRLAFRVSEFADKCCELTTWQSDCEEPELRLLKHEPWFNVARTVVLLEHNNVSVIRSEAPIDLKVEPGITDTIIDAGSCQG
jgi:hypothetical protein